MEKERYNTLKSNLISTLRMKFDHIKQYLDESKAAAMVGAGFSKPDATEMKEWKALGMDFRRLYEEPPQSTITSC